MIEEKKFLEKLGFDISTKGFEYLANILHNYDLSSNFNCGSLLMMVADDFHTNYKAIERDIRYTIKKSSFSDKTLKQVILLLNLYFERKVDK